MDYLEEFPVLVIDDELHSDTAEGRASREIVKELKDEDFIVIEALTARGGLHAFLSHPHASCIVIDWELSPPRPRTARSPLRISSPSSGRGTRRSRYS